jgi:DNA helicase-2/ATP-dependent DNA helicase PcrA
MEEGLFPHENALSDHQGLEEERRLMYVAITRARKRLYLSHSQTRMLHGQTRYNIRSRFFDELPEHALKWLSAPAPGLNPASAWGSSRQHASVSAHTDWTAAIEPQASASSSGAHAWVRSGVQVFHNKFGEGTVLSLEGSGEDARAQVKFGRHGVKWLALAVAKLTPV